MADGLEDADKLAWCHTFAIVAQIGNTTKTKKSDVIDPTKFYPYEIPKADKTQRVTSGIPLTRGNVVQFLGAALNVPGTQP